VEQDNSNALHIAARHEALKIMEFLCKQAYKDGMNNYMDYVNKKNNDERSPLMMAALEGQSDAVKQLIRYGGVKLFETDKDNKRADQLAGEHDFKEVADFIVKQMGGFSKNPAKDVVTMINTTELSEPTEEEKENTKTLEEAKTDAEKDKILMKHGKPKPCIICNKPAGWLKYTCCCSRPIHPMCIKNQLECPACKIKPLRTGKEIGKPQNALEIPKKDEGQSPSDGGDDKKAE